MKVGAVFRFAFILAAAAPVAALAWDYPGHRIVNQLALASLPADFPRWVQAPASAERIAFLAGEPDRWRNSRAELLQHYNGLDHYFDLEELADAGLDVETLTPFRYVFAAQFAAGRAANPGRFPPFDPAKNLDHSREWPGFLPWAIAEYYAKLQSAFSYLKTFERYGTPAEIANARANVIYLMGVGGHYVGDGAQPLHTTIHFNGWVGPNPMGYTTRRTILTPGLTAASSPMRASPRRRFCPKSPRRGPLDLEVRGRTAAIRFSWRWWITSARSRRRWSPLVPAGKRGGIRAGAPDRPIRRAAPTIRERQTDSPEGRTDGPEGRIASPEGRAFIDAQLLKGGEMLGELSG